MRAPEGKKTARRTGFAGPAMQDILVSAASAATITAAAIAVSAAVAIAATTAAAAAAGRASLAGTGLVDGQRSTLEL